MLTILEHSLGGVRPLLEVITDWRIWLILLGASVIADMVHEFGHAWMADRLGDPGPRAQGRFSLNPLKHIDPLGTLLTAVTMLIGFPIGWGKSVKVDPDKFRGDKRVGMALVAACGPLANIALAVALAPLARWLLTGPGFTAIWVLMFVLMTIALNVFRFCIHLIPLHPMAASHVVAALLPEGAAKSYIAFMQRWGTYLFIGLMWTGGLNSVLVPLFMCIFRWLVGIGA